MVYRPKYEPSPEGRVMRQLRHTADLTQREVADLTGISNGCWGLIEIGRWRPTERIIRSFCKGMKLPLSMEERLLRLRATEFHQPEKEAFPEIKLGNGDDHSTKEMISEDA
jgi:transcriptional regulator with XRE-family HTH domain